MAVLSPILQVHGLTKRFGGVIAVRDVDFHVERNEIVSLIGPNGAGKTTVFNLVSGILQPTVGSVAFDGQDMRRVRPEQYAFLGMGRTFQNLALFRNSSVVENLLVGLHTHIASNALQSMLFYGKCRREEAAARRRAEEIIDFLEIQHLRDRMVGSLSYGQQKRVELGRALACTPKLLLLDEIVAGMNQEEREDIARFILDIRDQFRIAILMIEHDMRVVMDLSDRIYVLEFGSLIASGRPDEVRANPAVLAAYLGTHA